MRTLPRRAGVAVVAVLGLAGLGLAHVLEYLALVPDAGCRDLRAVPLPGTSYLPSALGAAGFLAATALAVVFLSGVRRWRRGVGRRLEAADWARLLPVAQVIAFVALEVAERLAAASSLADLGPVLVLGLPLQVLAGVAGGRCSRPWPGPASTAGRALAGRRPVASRRPGPVLAADRSISSPVVPLGGWAARRPVVRRCSSLPSEPETALSDSGWLTTRRNAPMRSFFPRLAAAGLGLGLLLAGPLAGSRLRPRTPHRRHPAARRRLGCGAHLHRLPERRADHHPGHVGAGRPGARHRRRRHPEGGGVLRRPECGPAGAGDGVQLARRVPGPAGADPAGVYTFRFVGTVKGQAIDETFTSSDTTFESPEETTEIEFPVKDPARPSWPTGSSGWTPGSRPRPRRPTTPRTRAPRPTPSGPPGSDLAVVALGAGRHGRARGRRGRSPCGLPNPRTGDARAAPGRSKRHRFGSAAAPGGGRAGAPGRAAPRDGVGGDGPRGAAGVGSRRPGPSLDQAPATVTLSFTEAPELRFSSVKVLDGTGRSFGAGGVQSGGGRPGDADPGPRRRCPRASTR